jgi:hypothetical protein
MKDDHVATDGAVPGNAAASSSPPKKPSRRAPGPEPGSGQANKLALLILDVLAGVRLPAEVAQQAAISLARYYHLEQRVLDAIVQACEPRPRGKVRSPQRQVEELQRQISRLEQQCARQQALLRAAQRTIGLAPPTKLPAKSQIGRGGSKIGPTTAGRRGGTSTKPDGAKPKRQRRPTVRALKAAKMLRAAAEASPSGADEAATAPPVAECVTNVT